MKILHLHYAFCIMHLHFAFCILHFEFKSPAKNSEFFRFKYLNFPPKFLDSIGVVAHGDNRGTSCIAALNQLCGANAIFYIPFALPHLLFGSFRHYPSEGLNRNDDVEKFQTHPDPKTQCRQRDFKFRRSIFPTRDT